jgi:hypothetical protein
MKNVPTAVKVRFTSLPFKLYSNAFPSNIQMVSDSLSMSQFESDEPLYGLMIADRGTTGLEGPTRADIVPEGSPRRFISFLRDVGQPSNQLLSGGTYGYGKASLYLASGMRTILVYTRCKLPNGRLESRFIAAALGQRWADKQHRQFTGRHWWGRDGKDTAEPVLNVEADELAAALGMGDFVDDETGTTILILDPLLNDRGTKDQPRFESIDRTPIQALNLMAEYALWFFWPKMLDNGSGHPSIQFAFQWGETPVKLPHPAEFPPLMGFVEAMERLKGQRNDEPALRSGIKDIGSERPRKHLGKLALQQFFIERSPTLDIGSAESPFLEMTHHTALMRQAELVVKYLEGRPLASSSIGYAGVFVADTSVDPVFAQAEPPTHDDWSPNSLTDSWHKTYVRVALRRIGEEMLGFAQAARTAAPSGILTPLGAFATWLGESLIPAESGPSASRPPQPSNRSLPNFPIRTDPGSTSVQSVIETDFSTNDSGEPASIDGSTSFGIENRDGLLPGLQSNVGQIETNQIDLAEPIASPSNGATPSSVPPNPILPPAPTFPTAPPPMRDDMAVTRKPIRGQSAAEIIDDALIEYENNPALLITFDVYHAENADGTTVKLKAQAVLDSGVIEDEPPVGAAMVHIALWISPSGEVFANTEGSIFIAASLPNEKWQVLVLLPDDMMVNIVLTAKAEAL